MRIKSKGIVFLTALWLQNAYTMESKPLDLVSLDTPVLEIIISNLDPQSFSHFSQINKKTYYYLHNSKFDSLNKTIDRVLILSNKYSKEEENLAIFDKLRIMLGQPFTPHFDLTNHDKVEYEKKRLLSFLDYTHTHKRLRDINIFSNLSLKFFLPFCGYINQINDQTPLSLAISYGLPNDVIKGLLKIRQEIDSKGVISYINYRQWLRPTVDNVGDVIENSALEKAVSAGNEEIAVILIELGANLEVEDFSLLYQAAKAGYKHIVQAVIKKIKEEKPNALYSYLNSSGALKGAKEKGHQDIIDILKDAGATTE